MIKINISNGLAKTALAYVLDREGVPERISEIREKWGIHKDFVPAKGFSVWLNQYHPELSLTKEAADYYGNSLDRFEIEDSRDKETTIEKLERIKKLSNFNIIDFELELLMRKFGITPKLKKLIIKAIVCNEIENGDLKEVGTNTSYDFLLDSQELRFVVEKNYKGNEKIELDRDREWYWKHKEGVFIKDIIGDYDSEEKVDKQIDRYRSFLRIGTSR